MNKDEVIAVLRAHKSELHRLGVRHAALFGSVARREQNDKSDIDILIEMEPGSRKTFFESIGLKLYVADLFPGRVDVIDRDKLKPDLKMPVESDTLYAF